MRTIACAALLLALGSESRADWIARSLHPTSDVFASSALAGDDEWQGGYAWIYNQWDRPIETPVVWRGSDTTMRNLVPAGSGFVAGRVSGMHGGRQVGMLNGSSGGRAVVWEGTAESYRVLPYNPNRYLGTEALAISGNQVVGVGYDANNARTRAAVWDLAAWTSRDLAPAGSHSSFAVGTDGSSQVGRVLFSSGGFRAAMWRGTPGSYVDLQPEGYIDGSAMGVAGNVQVGSVLLAEVGYRAALWRGSASSFVDLTPEGSIAAEVYATTGALHVGFVRGADGYGGATLWLGDDAGSAVNLHGFLGSEYWESVASAISVSSDGKVRISGRAMRQGYTREQAVVWVITSIPTPATLAVVSAGVLPMGRRRRRY